MTATPARVSKSFVLIGQLKIVEDCVTRVVGVRTASSEVEAPDFDLRTTSGPPVRFQSAA